MLDFNLNIADETDSSQIYDLIIIGGGPAGLTAGLYAARYKLNTLMIEKAFISGGQMAGTEWVENYPGFPEPVLGQKLAQNMESQAKSFGLKIINAYVDSVDLSPKIKEIKSGETIYKTKSVLITTGASPRKLGLANEEQFKGKGISYCATCDGPMYPDKKIAVIGGGNSACEESLFLAKYAKEIIIIQNLDHLTADPIVIEKLKAEPKIKVRLNSTLRSFDFSNTLNRQILIEDSVSHQQETLLIDGIFIFVGMIPNTQLFENQLELDHGYIKTDHSLQTNISGVYAAGDVIVKELRQVATAVGDGALAAYKINKFLEDH